MKYAIDDQVRVACLNKDEYLEAKEAARKFLGKSGRVAKIGSNDLITVDFGADNYQFFPEELEYA